MKNLNLTFVAIIFALFTLTSCEKESMTEMAQTAASVAAEEKFSGDTKIEFEKAITEATAESFKAGANSRNRGYKEISCGFDYDGCTIGQGNSLDTRHYPYEIDQLGASFAGQDEYFFFEVEATPNMTMIYDIEMTGLRVDLDIFVLALNSRNQITGLVDWSINSGAQNEKISLSGLAPGMYVVVVDAYRSDIAGHYNLTMECGAVGTGQSVEVTFIETTLGDAFPNGNDEWTFIETGSDIARIFQGSFIDASNISLSNVRLEGGTRISTNISMSLDNKNIAISTTYESDGATAIGDAFGQITNIVYSN